MGYSETRNAFDTYVNSAYPTKSYSTSSQLRVKSGQMLAYVSFARPYQPRSTVQQLQLVLRVMGDYPAVAGRTFTAKRQGNRTRIYRDLDWSNKPAAHSDGVTIAAAGALKGGDELVFPVTAHGQIWSDGADFDGWEISTNSSAEIKLYSTDTTAAWAQKLEPELRAWVADPPAAPINLAPSGNRQVSTRWPIVRWAQIDNNNGKQVIAARFQLDNVATFASVDFDSGEQPTDDGSLDLANLDGGVVFPGLPTDNSSRYWRVQVMDESGTWSDFSDPVSVRYLAKGTLTLVSPSAASPKVSDPTPPIAWTLSGATQRAYRIEVARRSKTGKTWFDAYDSGKKTTTQQTVTLPAGVLSRDDRLYRITLTVWDTAARQTTPGATAAYVIEREFYFNDDAAPTPVSTITTSQDGLWPRVKVRFTLASIPDRVIVSRDGQIVADIEAADLAALRQGDGSYIWVDRLPRAGRAATYTARPLSNGTMGWGNPASTITAQIRGRWLVTDDFEVFLAGTGQDLSLVERATDHETLGDGPAVRIVQGFGGWEGPVEGTLIRLQTGTTLDNVSSKTWRDRLMQIKRRQIPCTFIAGDIAAPVIVKDAAAPPSSKPRTPQGDLTYDFKMSIEEGDAHDWEAYE